MTPLIRDWVKNYAAVGADPTELMWFDISGAFARDDVQALQLTVSHARPPFEKCAVVAQGKNEKGSHDVLLSVVGNDPQDGIVVSAWVGSNGQKPRKFPLLTYVVKDGLLHAGNLDGEHIDPKDKEMMLRLVALWYGTLNQSSDAYKPSVKMSFTNRRKIAEGKTPTFDWVTVKVEPAKPKADYQGGTHASPRLHDRRGHLRKLPSGKTCWVKPCKVGDASKGVVFHDYKVTG